MTKTFSWLTIIGLVLFLTTTHAGIWAGEAAKNDRRLGEAAKIEVAPAGNDRMPTERAPGENTTGRVLAGLVGTVVAVVPESQTLVVDVPLERDVLRVGAWVTDETRIEARGVPVSLDSLEPGARVRIDVRRIPTGNEAISVVVLREPRG